MTTFPANYNLPVNDGGTLRFTVGPAKRIGMFLCVTLLCMIAGSVAVLLAMLGDSTPAKMRIAAVLQDLFFFILPPVVTALVVSRRPADLLMLTGRPRLLMYLLVVCAAFAMMPWMNAVVAWNESLTLPDSLRPLEAWMRQAETAAAEFTAQLLGAKGPGGLVMALLIVGVLAGFSEELFFRAGFQRLLATAGMNAHAAVWLTAFVFSAVHFQFYGFVPRMLLGAWFGYLAWWSRSLWLPAFAHILNNCLATVAFRLDEQTGSAINTFGAGHDHKIYAAIGLLLTAALVYAIWRGTQHTTEGGVGRKL